MPDTIENERVELAVIRTSFATKDDVQRIVALLYEHKLQSMPRWPGSFTASLSRRREEFHAALSQQRQDFHGALAQVQIDLNKTLISHIWKLYGLASLVLGGVYFIARYVH